MDPAVGRAILAGMARRYLIFETAAGFCGIGWSKAGIARFALPLRDRAAAERALRRRFPEPEPDEPPDEVRATVAAVRRYFDGAAVDLAGPVLDLGPQEPFAAAVYATVRGIAWGRTTTYGEIARALGAGPEAARDVGQAMARNPVPLIVPCHRVLAAGGRLGGFSAPGGQATKRRMLALEGIRLGPAAPAQATFAFWQ